MVVSRGPPSLSRKQAPHQRDRPTGVGRRAFGPDRSGEGIGYGRSAHDDVYPLTQPCLHGMGGEAISSGT